MSRVNPGPVWEYHDRDDIVRPDSDLSDKNHVALGFSPARLSFQPVAGIRRERRLLP